MIRIVATFTLVGILAAACSGGGMPLDEYGPAVEDLAVTHADEVERLGVERLTELDASIADLQRTMEGAALVDAAVEETERRTLAMFAAIADTLDAYIESLGGLDAPGSVSAEHAEYVDALRASRSGISPILEALPLTTSFDEIDRAIAGSGFGDALLRVEAACEMLEQAIEREGPEVDLRCGGAR